MFKKVLRNAVASSLIASLVITNPGYGLLGNDAKNVAYAKGYIDNVSVNNGMCDFEESGFTFTYNENATWNNYVSAEITITNNSGVDKSLWSLDMMYDGVIESVWNADVAMADKPDPNDTNRYIIKAMNYNTTIPSGGSVSFGFIAFGENDKPNYPEYIRFVSNETYEEVLEPSTPGDATEDKEIKGQTYKIPAKWKGLEYALFASNNGDENFYVNTAIINGAVHSNGNFLFQGNRLEVNGNLESCGVITLRASSANDSIKVISKNDYADIIEMPDLTQNIRKKIDESWEKKDGYANYGSDKIRIDSNMLVEGGISFNASSFSGSGIIVAKDSISYNVGNVTTIGDSRMFLESENGNININGGNINMNAVLYAPNGTVTINANELHLNGRIIAKNIIFNGTIIEVVASEHDYDMLNDLKIFEFEIVKKYDTSEDFLSDVSQFNNVQINEKYEFLDDENIEGLALRTKDTGIESISKVYNFGSVKVNETFTGEKDDDGNYKGNVKFDLIDQGSNMFSLNVKNDHVYSISQDYLPWYEAKAACEAMGGHLVVINDMEENNYVRDLAKAAGRSYVTLGYTDDKHEGRWEWVDGSNNNFRNWNGGEPNNGLSLINEQNFAYMYDHGRWDDGQGYINRTYVCEWDRVEDISYSDSKKVIVTATIPKEIIIDKEILNNKDYSIKKDKCGNSIVTWKADISSKKTFDIPVNIDSNKSKEKNIPVMKDIHIVHLNQGRIIRETIPDICINSDSYNANGYFEDIFDSDSEGVNWTYFDMDALYVNDSNIELYAFASDDLEEVENAKNTNRLKKIDLNSIRQEGKIEGIAGQYLYIKASLNSTTDEKYTPFIDSITIIGNTEKLVEPTENKIISTNLMGNDKTVVNCSEKYNFVVVGNNPLASDVNWSIDGENVEGANSYNEYIIFEKEGKHILTAKSSDTLYAEKEITVSKYDDIDEDYFDEEFKYPIFDLILSKTSYVEGETIKGITNIAETDSLKISYDEEVLDITPVDGCFEISDVTAGEHTIKVTATNSVNNEFTRETKVYVYDKLPDVDTWFDKQTYFYGDNPILSIEEGYIIDKCTLDKTKAEAIEISEDGSYVKFVKPNSGLHKMSLSFKNTNDETTGTLEIYMYINSSITTDTFDDYKYDDDDSEENATESDAKLVAKKDAIVNKAFNYIKSTKNNNGSFGDDKFINTTAETSYVYGLCGVKLDDKTKSWLDNNIVDNNVDVLSREIMATGNTKLFDNIMSCQNSDGGFGLSKEYKSDVWDSLLVLEAINKTGCRDYDDESWKLVNYIVNQINDNGSYSYTKQSEDNVIITSMALTSVKTYMKDRKITSDGTKTMLKRSYDYIISKGYGEVSVITDKELSIETAYAVMAINSYRGIDDNSLLLDYIEKIQKTNGSFNDDIHTTNIIIILLNNLKL